ncbi:sure-like protein [Trametes coccinea BRFM310]|uniref:Sure-like protein n=1 Tax=Trametes coccinea (strain BRFM310) TaxID=1353009 RepID=A0A1Y2ISR6_TRAC3|nr:sure-like protein [Trametes coccinea BRFM310]
MRAVALSLSVLGSLVSATNILISNDDGWATAQIRQQFDALNSTGYDVVLSCPALNQSGRGSLSKALEPLKEPCEFDTCPTGSPAVGSDASNPRLNYVNGYPVDAARYGIQTLSKQYFASEQPDFVVSGPNVGANLGLVVLLSGTVGAACEAARSGIPAGAFSGLSGSQVSYTTLETDPDSTSSLAARIYSDLTTTFVNALTTSDAARAGDALLPAGVIVNVNYAAVDACPSAASYKWVFSRLVWNVFATDVETCGSKHLPEESDVVKAGCYASVSVLDAQSKLDVNASLQAQVLERLQGLPLSCLPS